MKIQHVKKEWGSNRHGQMLREGDKIKCGNGNDTWVTHVQFDSETCGWHREQDYYEGIRIGYYPYEDPALNKYVNYTPGSWKISENGCDIETIDGAGIATLYAVSESQDKANAALISCAPELLECLFFIVNVANGKSNDKTKTIELRFERNTLLTWLYNANTVIKKATNEKI